MNKLGNNVGNDVGAKLRRTYPKDLKYKMGNPSFLERAIIEEQKVYLIEVKI